MPINPSLVGRFFNFLHAKYSKWSDEGIPATETLKCCSWGHSRHVYL